MINKFYKTQFDKKEKNTSKGEIYKKSKQRKQTKKNTRINHLYANQKNAQIKNKIKNKIIILNK